MTTELLTVILEGRTIGRLTRSRSGDLRLDYDDWYVADGEATPLSVALPAVERTHGDRVVTAWLWGLLPDNADVLARWGSRFSVSATSPFGLLGTQVGHDCAGAVQFARDEDLADVLERPGRIDWLDENEVAQLLAGLRSDSTSWLGRGFTGQFSLGGAQAKTALTFDGRRWGRPSGTPTTHILKPAIPGLSGHDINEHLCLSAANGLGLMAARSRIVRFGEETAIAVERYDRFHVDQRLVRIHQEDVCQATATHPARKYQAEGGPSPEQIAVLLRRVAPPARADDSVRRFADALAFNWLIAGTDAHAKNYSLLLSGPQVRLAPLYDIASALPYDTSKGYDLALAMKLGGDYKLRSHRRSTWPKVAQALGLDADALVDRVRDLATRAPEAFSAAAADPELTDIGDLPMLLVDLVARRSKTCLAILG